MHDTSSIIFYLFLVFPVYFFYIFVDVEMFYMLWDSLWNFDAICKINLIRLYNRYIVSILKMYKKEKIWKKRQERNPLTYFYFIRFPFFKWIFMEQTEVFDHDLSVWLRAFMVTNWSATYIGYFRTVCCWIIYVIDF